MYFGLGNIFGAKELSTTIIPQNLKPEKEKNVLFAMNEIQRKKYHQENAIQTRKKNLLR